MTYKIAQKVGGLEVFYNSSIIIPMDQTYEMRVVDESDSFRLKIVFVCSEDGKSTVMPKAEGDLLTITVTNLTGDFVSDTMETICTMDDGTEILMLLYGRKLPTKNQCCLLDLTFIRKEAENG